MNKLASVAALAASISIAAAAAPHIGERPPDFKLSRPIRGHDPMIPHVIILEAGLVMFKIYNGYWFLDGIPSKSSGRT